LYHKFKSLLQSILKKYIELVKDSNLVSYLYLEDDFFTKYV